MPQISVEAAVERIRSGGIVIIVDDEDRENEGDMAMSAETATPDAINFMVTHARGLVVVPMLHERLEQLMLPLMVQQNTDRMSTAFTVSVDAVNGTTTGISAQDRAATIKALVDPNTGPGDLSRPGHVFPLKYTEGGVLVRAGHTEAIIDLAKLGGLYPAGVLCEVLADDGSSARLPHLEKVSAEHNLGIVSLADIIAYRNQHENMVERVAEARLPTKFGVFKAISFRSLVDKDDHIALVMGDVNPDEPTLVRVHSACLTGDVFRSLRCDCDEQKDLAMEAIAHEGKGILLYLRQEGRGIGIHNKLKAYNLQDRGLDTVEANMHLGFAPDLRHYGVGAQMLVDLGVREMRVLTNNPKKVVGLSSYGLNMVEQVPIIAPPNKENVRYLETKRAKMGHTFEVTNAGKAPE